MNEVQVHFVIHGLAEVQRITKELEETEAKMQSLSKELTNALQNLKYSVSPQNQD